MSVQELELEWRERLGLIRGGSAASALLAELPRLPVFTINTASETLQRSWDAVNQAVTRLEQAGVVRQVTIGRRNRAYEVVGLFEAMTAYERILASLAADTSIAPPSRPTSLLDRVLDTLPRLVEDAPALHDLDLLADHQASSHGVKRLDCEPKCFPLPEPASSGDEGDRSVSLGQGRRDGMNLFGGPGNDIALDQRRRLHRTTRRAGVAWDEPVLERGGTGSLRTWSR
ncbi:MAG: filamentation induced by cAMP protein Fic [Frankiales bacterium]|nr:filamentation induced by cAMP protein Fic [Frankiales bacterium]